MSVYFVQPIDGGPIKIGCTDDVPGRLKALERHYGVPLSLLATMPGHWQEEQAIHERFAHLRLGRTEQFQPAADLLAFIGRPLLVDPNPEAVEAIAPAQKWVSIQLTDECAKWCRIAAGYRGLSLTQYVNEVLGPLIKADAIRLAAEFIKSVSADPDPPPEPEKPKARAKGKGKKGGES